MELEVPTELLLLKQKWEPVAVIGPHVSKGDLVQLEPLRAHFWIGWEKEEEEEHRFQLP